MDLCQKVICRRSDDGKGFACPSVRVFPNVVEARKGEELGVFAPDVVGDFSGGFDFPLIKSCCGNQAAPFTDRLAEGWLGLYSLDAGVDDMTSMQITGHKTRSVFDRYNVRNEQDMKNAAEKLSRLA